MLITTLQKMLTLSQFERPT